MNLLIVENDKTIIQSYQDRIDLFNSKNEFQIDPEIVENVEDAELKLKTSLFDAAIIDLKLKNEYQEFNGELIINNILENLRIPIFVVSGSIAQYTKAESALFKKRNRDVKFDDILNEIIEIYNTGITKILGNKGIIDQYLQSIFWSHISKSIDLWKKDHFRTDEEKEKSLLRYTILHIQEYIDNDIQKYHPSEFYISKPIKIDISTGDIVIVKKDRFVLITPACDMVKREQNNRNAEFVQFCKIKDLRDVVKNYDSLNSETSEKNENRIRLTGFLENKNQRYHFIPKSDELNAGLIDFQEKITIPNEQLNMDIEQNNIQRIASISTPFLKDIISRFANYISRQGSPDFKADQIYHDLFS